MKRASVIIGLLIVLLAISSIYDTYRSSDIRTKVDVGPKEVVVPVLMYHHFEPDANKKYTVTPEKFKSDMLAIESAGYTTISITELLDYVNGYTRLPEKPILITFDDGYESNYTYAYPILKELKMKATIFVIGCYVGQEINPITGTAITPPRFSYETARLMYGSGLIEIQSHSYEMHEYLQGEEYREGILQMLGEAHEDYVDTFNKDFKKSKQEIESKVRNKVIAYAYPEGRYTKLTENLLKEMDVKMTFTITKGVNIVKTNKLETLFELKRIPVYSSTPSENIVKIIDGYIEDLDPEAAENRNSLNPESKDLV